VASFHGYKKKIKISGGIIAKEEYNLSAQDKRKGSVSLQKLLSSFLDKSI